MSTGKTMHQLKEAPRNAFFIWSGQIATYPRNLARAVGRSDLRVLPRNQLRKGTFTGMRDIAVVLDHAMLDTMTRREEGVMKYLSTPKGLPVGEVSK